MEKFPLWGAVSYNVLSLHQTRRLRHILSELRWYSFVCLQASQRRTSEPVLQYDVGDFHVVEWGYGPAAGKSAGLVIAFRQKLFSLCNLVRVYTPPPELLGRVGAIRLERGDADFMVINAYVPVNPHRVQDQRYCDSIWAWVHLLLSQAPSRCMPILCCDANGRVGKGPDAACIGPEQRTAENYNGKKLRELLSDHYMAATNTFYPAGDTYFGQFGNSSRIDYVCIPQSMLDRVDRCSVLYAAGKRLQIIPAAGKRDHMPVHCSFRHKLVYELAASTFQWDREALARGVLHGHRRDRLLRQCEHALERANVDEHTDSTPDTIWNIINTAVVSAARECYPKQKKHTDDPADTQAAHDDMVEARVQLVSLPKPHRLSTIFLEEPSMEFMSGLLQQWKCLVQYWRARRRLDMLAKRDRAQWSMAQVSKFNGAWFRRDFRTMWTVARVLSGKQIGPKNRVYSRPISMRPTLEDWTAHLALPGHMGGWNAQRDPAAPLLDAVDPPLAAVEVASLATEDLRGLSAQIHRSKLGRTVPDWAAPSEVWRQLFHPSYHQSQLRSGIGYVAFAQKAPFFQAWMRQLASSIRRWERTPSQWQHSMSFQLDKRNGKPGCQGLRLVSCLDPCGAAFYKYLWRCARPDSYRAYAAGYCKQKSRLEPICQMHMVSHRLRAKKLSHARSFFDVQNAFPSQSTTAISLALDSVARPRDRPLWDQRHKQALVRVSDGCQHADFCPGSGTMQGDGPSAELFLEPYHPQLDLWANDVALNDPRRYLVATCRILFGEDEQDLSMATFADDVSRISLGQTPYDLCLALQVANASLDRRLWDIELVQNIQKQEHIVYFGGSGCQQHYETVYGNSYLPGKTVQSARYLGARAHYAGKTSEEVNVRIQAATRNWVRMGSFWFRSGATKRGKTLVYSALVHSALLSGLETLVLEPHKYTQLNTLVLRHGRKLMQGKACEKSDNADGTVKYKACRSKAVWKWLGLCPCELELQVRRLQWYQQLARDRYRHKCVLMAMFGKLGCEHNDTVDPQGCILPHANPWANQFYTDIQALRQIDAGQALLEYLGERVVLVFTSFASDFLAVDVSAMRGTYDPVCIPPPGWIPPEVPELPSSPSPERERPFVCDCILADGRRCGVAFHTAKALATHKSSTKGGTHDAMSDISKVAITNACPWCKNVFSSQYSARNHISRTLKEGKCGGSGSRIFFTIDVPENLQCRVCEDLFENVHQLLDHVITHVSLQPPAAPS